MPSIERRRRKDRGTEGAEGVGSCAGGITLPSRLGSLGKRGELPQRGPGRSPGRQRILGIFQRLRSLLVEGLKFWGHEMCLVETKIL